MAVGDGTRLWRAVEPMDRGHAERLFPLIDQVLAEAGLGYSDLTGIAVCEGPGSFTGTRVGISAARGLALGCSIPAIGITRFEALAAMASPGQACTVVLPGRRETVYRQAFDANGRAEGEPVMSERSAPAERPGPLVGVGGALGDGLLDPGILVTLALDRVPGERPAPLYLRGPDAALPREGPPRILDP